MAFSYSNGFPASREAMAAEDTDVFNRTFITKRLVFATDFVSDVVSEGIEDWVFGFVVTVFISYIYFIS